METLKAYPHPSRDIGALVQVAFAASSWGTWSLFLRPTGLPGTVTSAIAFVAIGLASLALIRFDPHTEPRWDRTTWLLLGASAVLNASNLLTFFAAMARTTVAVAVITHYLAPILVALLAPLVERSRVPGAILAAVVAMVGLVLLLAPWQPENRTGHVVAGALLGAASAVGYAGNVLVQRKLVPRIGATRAVAYHALLGIPMLALVAAPDLHLASLGDIALVLTGGVLLGGVSGVLFSNGLPRIGATRAAILTFLEPTVAVIVGWLVWGEPLGILGMVGGALILAAGIYAATRRPPPAAGSGAALGAAVVGQAAAG